MKTMTSMSFVRGSRRWDHGVAGKVLSEGDVLEHQRAASFPSAATAALSCSRVYIEPGMSAPPLAQGLGYGRALRHVEAHGRELRRAGEDLLRRAVHGYAPLVEDHQPVGNARGVVHAVRDEQDGGAGPGAVFEDVPDYLLAAAGVEAGRGLVEDKHARAHGDNAGDGYAALSARRRARAGSFQKSSSPMPTKPAASRTRSSTSASASFMFLGPKAMSLYTVSSKS